MLRIMPDQRPSLYFAHRLSITEYIDKALIDMGTNPSVLMDEVYRGLAHRLAGEIVRQVAVERDTEYGHRVDVFLTFITPDAQAFGGRRGIPIMVGGI